jgi:galactose mutarotase-like enzyme
MNTPVAFPTGKCTISDDWTYKNMPVIWMENDFLRIGILAGRGSDIFEFRYKPKDVDFMLRLAKGIVNPNIDFSQQRGTNNQFEDYYYGGWQEILPNSPAFHYRGAALGQHGEVSLTPWKHAILENTPERVSVKLWTRPLRVPILIEKTLTLEAGKSTLFIQEKLTNEANTPLEVVWGHHIAFGLPFLNEGAKITTNARTFYAEPLMPPNRRFQPGIVSDFPHALNIDGAVDDASIVHPVSEPPYSDMAYLSDFDDKGYYALKNEAKNVGFAVAWDARIFKHVWYWLERYGTQDAPWWGSAYAVALEPWTNRWRPDPQTGIDAGEWLRLEAGAVITTALEASGFEGDYLPQ